MAAKKSRKTPEQRQVEAQALHNTLIDQVARLTESGEWHKFLDFARSFHGYSFNNLLLILAQRPDATLVAGYRQWEAKGRQVRKGERALKIRGFSTKKVTEEDPDTGDEIERKLARFPILSVFDIAQTDPIDGVDQPEHPARTLTGEDPAGIYDTMAAHMTGHGWSVTRDHIGRGANGYTTTDGTKRIVVDQDLTPAQAAKTMLHEAAHATLHVDQDGNGDQADYVAHRGLRECEAESVAYVLAGLLDLDTADYSVGYITSWTEGDTDLIRSTGEAVLAGVRSLAPAFDRGGDTVQ